MTASLESLPIMDVTDGVRPGVIRNPHAKMIEIAWRAMSFTPQLRLLAMPLRVRFRDLEQVEVQLNVGQMTFVLSVRDARRFGPMLLKRLADDAGRAWRLTELLAGVAATAETIGAEARHA